MTDGGGKIIAVSGPPGSGKSTVCRALAKAWGGAEIVEYDAYETMTRRSPPEITDWLNRGAPYDEIETPGLAEALAEARAKGTVVFETQLGRAQPEIGTIIDFAVWLECPADVALARKIGQFAAGVPSHAPQAAEQFRGWLRGYLAAYETIIRPACAIQKQRVANAADIIVDGGISTADQVSLIMEKLP